MFVMANELSVRYSQLTNTKLRASLVTKDNVILNTRFEGSPTAGSVKIPTRGEATVGDYVKGSGANLDGSSTTYVTMNIDKDKYINELIDGFDAASVPDDIIADRIDSAGYGLANQMDIDACATLVAEGTVADDTEASTIETAYDNVVDARTALSKAKVQQVGRWLLVSPEFYSLILKDSAFIRQGDLSQEIVKTGAVGAIAGFNVYECANLPDGTEFVAGHPDCATRADEFSVPVHVQDLAGSGKYIGACAVQGRSVYGHKVTHKAGIYVKKFA
jgi:hypothetical protein